MPLNVAREVATLHKLGVKDLRRRYTEVFGEETPAHNKAWLIKRITWRLQAQAEGDLSERARQRAAELANEADLRLSPPRPPKAPTAKPASVTPVATTPLPGQPGVPLPGTILTRTYKGQVLQVKVLDRGFEYQGEVYRSLSAVAKAITGTHCSGNLFFGLARKGAMS